MDKAKKQGEDIFCPLCGNTHQVIRKTVMATALIKGEQVPYEQETWLCDNSPSDENEFVPAQVMDENLNRARNAYRKAHGLLQSQEIVAIRKEYGLTQKELAKLLGWGEATIARYETKFIQEQAHDVILQSLRDNAMFAEECLEKNQAAFDERRYSEIHDCIARRIRQTSLEYHIKFALNALYVDFENQDDLTGKCAFSSDKVCAMADFFARNCIRQLFKVKLMKMLWYADAVCFRDYGHAMSGLVYQHKPMGALPVGHYEVMTLIPHEEVYDQFEHTSYRILPQTESATLPSLDVNETEILKRLLTKFDVLTGKQLADYMHQEAAYQRTADEEYIPYSLAKLVAL